MSFKTYLRAGDGCKFFELTRLYSRNCKILSYMAVSASPSYLKERK
jgi:hypothetical protein